MQYLQESRKARSEAELDRRSVPRRAALRSIVVFREAFVLTILLWPLLLQGVDLHVE